MDPPRVAGSSRSSPLAPPILCHQDAPGNSCPVSFRHDVERRRRSAIRPRIDGWGAQFSGWNSWTTAGRDGPKRSKFPRRMPKGGREGGTSGDLLDRRSAILRAGPCALGYAFFGEPFYGGQGAGREAPQRHALLERDSHSPPCTREPKLKVHRRPNAIRTAGVPCRLRGAPRIGMVRRSHSSFFEATGRDSPRPSPERPRCPPKLRSTRPGRNA